jgi:hypothetical protein
MKESTSSLDLLLFHAPSIVDLSKLSAVSQYPFETSCSEATHLLIAYDLH